MPVARAYPIQPILQKTMPTSGAKTLSWNGISGPGMCRRKPTLLTYLIFFEEIGSRPAFGVCFDLI